MAHLQMETTLAVLGDDRRYLAYEHFNGTTDQRPSCPGQIHFWILARNLFGCSLNRGQFQVRVAPIVIDVGERRLWRACLKINICWPVIPCNLLANMQYHYHCFTCLWNSSAGEEPVPNIGEKIVGCYHAAFNFVDCLVGRKFDVPLSRRIALVLP